MKHVHTLRLITLLAIIWFILLATACSSAPVTPTVTPTPAIPTPNATEEVASATTEASELGQLALDEIAVIAAQRTPMPTSTPSPARRLAEDIVQTSGIAEKSFLGLAAKEWIDVGVSILLVIIVGYVLGVWLLFRLLNRVVRRTETQFDDEFLGSIERELKWLVLIIVVRFAVQRLDPWSIRARIALDDIFFILTLAVLYVLALRLIAFAARWYREYKVAEESRIQVNPFIEMLKRLGYLLASVLALSSALSQFGLEITMLTAIILFATVVLILGARAAVTDAISGFVILVSQPFRVNDTIYIKELDTRGDVEKIGILSTHIRTRDGREVIVPNALIGTSQVVNYTYPDPNFRVEVEFSTDGAEIELIQEIIEKTVRGVEGVLPDKPVDVLYLAYGGTGRQFRVRWWIDDVNKHNRSRNSVNVVLDRALLEAGIDSPDPTYDLNLKVVGEKGHQATQSLSGGSGEESSLKE